MSLEPTRSRWRSRLGSERRATWCCNADHLNPGSALASQRDAGDQTQLSSSPSPVGEHAKTLYIWLVPSVHRQPTPDAPGGTELIPVHRQQGQKASLLRR